MFNESKPIKAKDIIENPNDVHGLVRAYVVVEDSAPLTGQTKHYLDAIEIMFQAGWEIIDFSHAGTEVRILFFNTFAKRKNG